MEFLYINNKNSIEVLLKEKPELIKKIICVDNRNLNESYKKIIVRNKIKTIYINEKEFLVYKKNSSSNIVLVIEKYKYCQLTDIISKNVTNSKLLILDKIHDSYNFGAIIRSAHLYDINGICVLNRNQSPINEAVINASCGSVFLVNICEVNNITNLINILKNHNYWIYATNICENSLDIEKTNFEDKCAIIIGNEKEGVSNKIIKNSDYSIKINTKISLIDSLNVSVATGIILNKLYNKKNEKL